MSAPAAPRPEDADARRTEEAVASTTTAVVAAVIELARALRKEFELFQRSGEAFLGRLKGSFARSLKALQRALLAGFLAGVMALVGAVVLAIFLVAFLNHVLGDPWGTGLTALLLLSAAFLFYMRARAAFREMEREAEALIRGPLQP